MEINKKTKLETLGYVKSTTGKIILIDFGCLWFWYHDKPPSMPEWAVSDPDIIEQINTAIDIKIIGSDAEKAGKLFDRNWHPEYIYDIPRKGFKKVDKLFKELVKKHKLNANLVIIDKRITHRERIEIALEYGKGVGEIIFNGMWAIVIAGIPINKEIPIYGIRMSEEKWDDKWKWVILEINPENNITTTTRQIGYVLVDEARLLFSDIDTLPKFEIYNSFDGKADLVFWGRDGEALSKKLNAQRLEDEVFGWKDLEVNVALEKAKEIYEIHESKEFRFAFDYRPHTHDYYLLEQIRSSNTASGMINFGDTISCGFSTIWGDGAFPVFAEFTESNELVRIKIELGHEKIIASTEKLIGNY
ncbi:MAG: hypothetical protein KF758_01370 [Anaerolineales bacterium]|nr:hypothetical protein [Anaerolineales bacterium]